MLIFLMSEEALWPKSKQDKGRAAEQIEVFPSGTPEQRTPCRKLL